MGARELLEALARSSPTSAQGAVAALLGLVELDGGVRDDIAILAARVKTRVVSERPLDPSPSRASGVPEPLLRAATADAPDD